MAMAVPRAVQVDLLESSAVVPVSSKRIDEPRDVRRLRVRLEGADLARADLDGAGQRVTGDIIEIVDPRTLEAEARTVDPCVLPAAGWVEVVLEWDPAAAAAPARASAPRAVVSRVVIFFMVPLRCFPRAASGAAQGGASAARPWRWTLTCAPRRWSGTASASGC